MRPILTIPLALLLTACGAGGPAEEPQTAPKVTLAPATPVVCQTIINGVVTPCGS